MDGKKRNEYKILFVSGGMKTSENIWIGWKNIIYMYHISD